MTAGGAIGLVAGITAGLIALTGWALGSAVEGLPRLAGRRAVIARMESVIRGCGGGAPAPT